MELKKKRITYYRTALSERRGYEENTEVIVPDAYPDVAKVVGVTGNAFIREKNVQSDRILVSGVIETVVFYLPEEGEGVKILRVPVSFAHIENTNGLPESAEVWTEAALGGLSAHAPNPRKLAVKADLMLFYEACTEKSEEIACGVTCTPEEGVEIKIEPRSCRMLKGLKRKTVSLLDTVALPEGGSAADLYLCGYDATVDSLRLVAEKAVVKGELRLQTICCPKDGEPTAKVHAVPFSQIIEMPGAAEDDTLSCRCAVRMAEIAPEEASENSGTLKAEIELLLMAERLEKVSALTDLYSTCREEQTTFTDILLPSADERRQARETVRETLPGEMAATRVLCTSCMIGACQAPAPSVLSAEITLSALYQDSAGGYGRAEKTQTVSFTAEPGTKAGRIGAGIASGSIGGDGKIELQAEVWCDIAPADGEKLSTVSTSELGEPGNRSVNGSFVLRYGRPGEELWQVAKEYRAAIAEIEAANRLPSGEKYASGVLLIPLKK